MDFWRIRMKVGGRHERSATAWDRNEVGGWYGAWSAAEWVQACLTQPNNPWLILQDLPHQQELGWDFTPDVAAIRRLEAVAQDDWVVVYLRDRGEIGLAQLVPGLHSNDQHPLNHVYEDGSFEIFKYRNITNKKSFKIAELPDAYRLLPAQGRSNLHQFHGMRGHVRLLAEHPDTASVRQAIGDMPFDQLIDILGASAWESVCTAYLTLEHGFVPTGLKTGSTLPVFDIVGRNFANGAHILAQCKKNPHPVIMSDDFLTAIGHHAGNISAFYFAYGGCHGDVPPDVHVIGKREVLAWAQTENGGKYRRFLAGL